MFIIRFGSTCSMQISDMPPHKKLKTDGREPEFVDQHPQCSATTESESEAAVDFGCDWRERCKSLREKYSYALRNNILADVKLVVGEEASLFHCHRLILALGSPVFEAMFFGELAEMGDTVTIPDIDPEGFQHLIRFLYTDVCLLKNEVIAFKTYFAADKYCVTELKRRCENFLCFCEVSPANVWLFFENALFLNSQAIKERCLDVLRQNLTDSLEQGSFLSVSLNTVESLLGLDDLNISEIKILENIVRWAEYQSQGEGADSFENTLKPLLSNIRFAALTAEEFVNLRHKTRLREVLSDDDSLMIVEHLINPSLCRLPDWCCTQKQRCYEPEEKVDVLSKSSKKKKKRRRSDHYKREFPSPPSFSYSSSSSISITSSSDSSSSSTESSE